RRARARPERRAPSQAMPERTAAVGVAPPDTMVRQSFTWALVPGFACAVFAHEREQMIEIERLLQKRGRIEVAGAGQIECRKHDHRNGRERGIGLLLAP